MGTGARTPRRFRHFALCAAVAAGALSLMLLSGTGSSVAAPATMGDANCDGAVEARDAHLALGAASGLGWPAPCIDQTDVDCDGWITAADTLIILKAVADLRSTVNASCPRVGSELPGVAAAPTETPTSTPAPTETPASTPTPTPTSTPTQTPAPTQTPTQTPTPTPTPTPGSGGMPALPQAWVGVNVWGLAATDSLYSCGSAGGSHVQFLDDTLSQLRAGGVDVVRFWAFQAYAMSPTGGTRDWSALDSVFARALEHGVYLMPALDNYWNDCNYWPITLWPNGQSHDGYTLSPTQWIDEVVNRYSGHPALLLWEVVNEPEAASHSSADVQAFGAEMAGLVAAVKAADPNTPVSLGNIGSGQHGFSAAAYKDTFLASGADWATAHDYQDWDVPIPWPNSCDWNSMCSDLEDAEAMGVPFYIGETGSSDCDNVAKANSLRAKIEAYHAQGAVGLIYWAFDIRANAGNCGFDIGPDGPTMAVFSEF